MTPLLGAASAGQGAATVIDLDHRALADAAQRGNAVHIEQVTLADGLTVDLELEPFDIIGPRTRFVVAPGDRQLDPPEVTLFRGHVTGEPFSHVYLAFSARNSVGSIEMGPGAPRYQLSSRTASGAHLPPGRVAVFEAPVGIGPLLGVPVCGLQEAGGPAPAARSARAAMPIGPDDSAQQIQLAIDADYEYFTLFGDAGAAADYIVQLYGAVSDIYLRDVNARVELSFVRIWDGPGDPYDDPDPLGGFVDHWNQNMGHVERDVAQLLTGRRDLPYGGVAYLPGLCSDFGYSVTGYILGSFPSLDSPSTSNWDVIVTAHELGHNCGGPHTHSEGIDNCAGGDLQRGTILSYCHTTPGGNANIDLRFHTHIQQLMESFFTEVDCLANDCNGNSVDDATDIMLGGSDDDNANGVPDECEDCNGNGILDSEDIAGPQSEDLNSNGIPDECEPDCNDNNLPDDLDIAGPESDDDNGNGIPDECEADCNDNQTPDYNEIQADMSLDLDRNAVLDGCQDCDDDGTTDLEALGGANDLWIASTMNVLSRMHAATGVLVTTSDAGHLLTPRDLVIRPDGHLLASSLFDNRVVEFDADGAYVGDLVASGAGGLSSPAGMILTPAGTLLVASADTNNVLAYDAGTGAPLGEFVTAGDGGLTAPSHLAPGPNGNLFVTSGDDQVREYDGTNGDYVRTLVTAGSGGLSLPRGLVFKPDGDLLVSSIGTDEILEYDGQTGAFLGQWDHGGLDSGFWALNNPDDLAIGPNGNVYVTTTNGNTAVQMYDVGTGGFMRSYYVLQDAGPVGGPSGIAFVDGSGIDCNLNQVPDGCDIDSGYSQDVNGDGVPDECAGVPGDIDGDGIVGILDFLAMLGAWGDCPQPCPPACPGDLDGDCEVGITDFLLLLAYWT
jgi:WD40 repeat protein